MSSTQVEYSRVIDASAERIYGVLSDYETGHRAILPKPYFVEMTVEQGGRGAGTVIHVQMRVMGVTKTYHMDVTEPEPGRVLKETDRGTGLWTTFTVHPLNGEPRSRVTITSHMPVSAGVTGFMEKLINPPVTRFIYKKELANLAAYVA